MAEVLITLSVLGIIAALTVPTLVNGQSKLANKVKFAKAAGVFEDVVFQMQLEENIRTNQELIDYATNNNCQNVPRYLKYVQRNGCKFLTSDGVWWEFKSANRQGELVLAPNISIIENNLTDEKAYDPKTCDAVFFKATFNSNNNLNINLLETAKAKDGTYSYEMNNKLQECAFDKPAIYDCGANRESECSSTGCYCSN